MPLLNVIQTTGKGGELMGEREQWILSVQKRLQRVTATGDLSLVLEDSALTEADNLLRTLTDDNADLPAMWLLGWLRWYRCQALPERFQDGPAGRR